jgi:hypothetical protein
MSKNIGDSPGLAAPGIAGSMTLQNVPRGRSGLCTAPVREPERQFGNPADACAIHHGLLRAVVCSRREHRHDWTAQPRFPDDIGTYPAKN